MPNIDGVPHHLSDETPTGPGRTEEVQSEPKRGRRSKSLTETKSKPLTVRRHKVENINRNQLAPVLDAYAAEGRVVIALNISRDIGGTYEVVSYKDELAN